MKVKICGLTRKEDIAAVNAFLPDYAGFVFAESKRRVTPLQAASLIKNLDPVIRPVGVFVNMDCNEAAAVTRVCGLKAVQLHGREDDRYLSELRTLLPENVQIIKALRVQNRSSLLEGSGIPCDLILLDAYKDGLAGGTGEVFDWTLLQDSPRPYILAGGLSPSNLQTAVETLHPYGVDVSSGVETGGLKDREKIRDFIHTARRYSHER
ncbi:MAG: N-(5'-phosphoribosyl)anthranilate isomerase [Candidatus Dichloromethanomonas elyunquensis]|nr:MAG: N-(5'-phosphoribosyl)anthranilate isomerase [Candidatus Dichloromethanomonas elyunquensis]